MPQDPHWYTLRRTWPEDQDFADTVALMRTHGPTERYKGHLTRLLHINGWKYWTMSAPIPSTILINRKLLPLVTVPYDAIALQYDALFQDSASHEENAAVMGLIGDVTASRVLDIGCGTGLLLDHCTPGAYCGLDPSRAMLDRLCAKHPAYAETLCGLMYSRCKSAVCCCSCVRAKQYS